MLWAWMRHRPGPFNSFDSSIHCTMPPSHLRCAVSREAQRHQSTWTVGKAKQPKWWRSNANSQTFHTVEIPEIFFNPWPSFRRKCVLKMWDTHLNCKLTKLIVYQGDFRISLITHIQQEWVPKMSSVLFLFLSSKTLPFSPGDPPSFPAPQQHVGVSAVQQQRLTTLHLHGARHHELLSAPPCIEIEFSRDRKAKCCYIWRFLGRIFASKSTYRSEWLIELTFSLAEVKSNQNISQKYLIFNIQTEWIL